MVEFVANSLERKKKQLGNNSHRIVVLRGQRRASQVWRICPTFNIVSYSFIYLARRKRGKKGEELLNAKGRKMFF